MNNEIKELIRDCNELLNDEFFTLNNIEITRHELNLLLDYITNLQQENERLNNVINELNAKLNQYEEREEMQYLIKDEERFNYSMSDQVDY